MLVCRYCTVLKFPFYLVVFPFLMFCTLSMFYLSFFFKICEYIYKCWCKFISDNWDKLQKYFHEYQKATVVPESIRKRTQNIIFLISIFLTKYTPRHTMASIRLVVFNIPSIVTASIILLNEKTSSGSEPSRMYTRELPNTVVAKISVPRQ